MNSTKQRLLTLLLAFVMIFTSLPVSAFAATGGDKKAHEITDIKTVGDKQVINLGEVQGKSNFGFFSKKARLFGATSQQSRSADETVAQKVEINLDTLGLNLGDTEFDSSALTEAGSFDVKITFKELGGTRTETRTMFFQAGETKKTETFYLPKDFGNGHVDAEIPKLKDNIALRVYVGATGTTNFNLGQDMTYRFELTQIIHPIIGLKVVDPYGKELEENINQDLGLKLALEEEHKFDLPANTKTLNIRTLDDFTGYGLDDLNSTGANPNPTLSLTTALDANKRLKVGDKTYKLNKITYNAQGQEVEINGKTEKVGGYIEFATQPKIIVPTPDENGDLPQTPNGYKRLSFHAETSSNAQDGRFEDGAKLKVIDVLEGTVYTDADLQKEIKGIGQPTPLINGRKDDNKKFLKWKPELPTTGEVADIDFYPVYLANGGEIKPGEKLPDGVFEVMVVKDDTIAKDNLFGKSYGVFDGSTLARDKFPDLEAAKGHQNPKWTATIEGKTEDEPKPWTKVINKNTTFKATASKLPDIIENPTKPTPEGYVRVTFKAGEGVEDFKDAKTYDVKEGTALAEKQYPTAKAKVGYKDPKWDVAPGTAITSANATITAIATKIDDIVPGGQGVDKPEGYYIVEFLEGKHGEFKPVKENGTEKPQVTVYYVNPEAKVKMSQIPAPEVTAKVGYKFDSWSKEYEAEAIITGDRQITAVYIYVEGVSTEAKDGWTKVTLKSGTKGQFTKTTNVEGGQPKTEEFDDLVYYVDPAREVTIPAPVVKATVGNTFTGFDKPLTGTFKTETDINAKYLSTSDVIEDKTPGDDTEKPEGYVTVKFDAGQNGKFAANSVTKYFVNPEKEVEIGAPGVEPNKNFVFKGFFNGEEEHSSAKKKYAKDVTYTAKYEDKSGESIIPGDQQKPGGWVTISFSAGEHGTFELVNGEQPTIAYHVNPEKEVVLKDKAPKVKANDGYKFTKYDPDVETARKYTTEGQIITAQYKPTVVTEDPNDKEHYAKVDFAAGDQGKFDQVDGKDQVTTFWVWKNEKVSFNAPKVTANENYKFKEWDKPIQETYDADTTHTATYESTQDVSDTEVKGYQEVKFMAGADGNFGMTGETPITEKSVWVRPGVEVDLTTKAPKVTANKGKVHTGWDRDLVGTFTKSETPTEITAKYSDDKDGNGVADDKEQFDIKKATKVEILKNPDKMKYLVNKPDGKAKFETAGLVVKYTDDSGKSATYTAEELAKMNEVTIKPANNEEIGLTPEGKTNEIPFEVSVNGKTNEVKPNVIVQLDADGNGTADEDEKSKPAEDVKALNQNKVVDGKVTDKPKDTTTVTGKAKPGSTVIIKNEAGDQIGKVEKVGEDGTFTAEVTKQEEGKKVKVVVTEPGKQDSDPVETTVVRDSDNDGEDDTKAGQTERPAAIASNKGKTPTFTTIEGKTEKGATITVTLKDGTKVKVDEFNIDNDGNYTLHATVGDKALENGAEILVYAENEPKKISKPQTTTVFNDFNNDGKPDGGKVDLTDVKDIQVIAPEKMSYTQGEKLNGTGLKAVVRDNKGAIEIFDYDNATGKFKDADGKAVADITATVANKPIKDLELTEKEHDGKAIDVKVGEKTGSTNQKLEVKQLQTPTPTIKFAANQNTVGSDGSTPTGTAKQKTTVKFTVKNKPTTVYFKYTVNGETKEESFYIGADDELTKAVDLQVKLPVGTEVKVLAKDADKTLSEAATAKVVRDANNDGTPDDKTPVGKATIDPIKAQSEKITVKPADNATELVIKETDKSGNTPADSKEITVKKDSNGNWTIDGKSVEKDGDKLVIPTKDKLKLDEYNVVEVESKGDPETTTPSTSKEVVGEAADTTAPDKPVVDQPVDGDKDIKVKTPTEKDAKTITVEVKVPGAPGEDPTKKTVVVEKDDKGNWKVGDTPVKEENGKLVIPVDPAVKKGDTVTVEVKDESGNGSKSDPKEVIARQQLPAPTINPIKINEKAVAGTAKDATTVDIYKKVGDKYELIKEGVGVNSDGTYNYPGTTPFKDGDVIRVVAKKDGWTPNNAEATVGVDTTALDKAIQDGKDALDKINDGTPEDKALEKAIQDAEDLKKRTDPKPPTQDELDKAQKEIEKAIENKKKTDEERQKLKDIIKEAEEETQKDGYKDKPGKDRRELEKAIKEGKASLENNTKVPESTTKIEKALEKIRKETLKVGLKDTKVGNQSITITSYPSYCKVKIFINDIYIDEIKTDGFGSYRYTLDEPIKSGTTIELNTHKDGYNDDNYWTRVK